MPATGATGYGWWEGGNGGDGGRGRIGGVGTGDTPVVSGETTGGTITVFASLLTEILLANISCACSILFNIEVGHGAGGGTECGTGRGCGVGRGLKRGVWRRLELGVGRGVGCGVGRGVGRGALHVVGDGRRVRYRAGDRRRGVESGLGGFGVAAPNSIVSY